jgi:hypothetical protein
MEMSGQFQDPTALSKERASDIQQTGERHGKKKSRLYEPTDQLLYIHLRLQSRSKF